MKERAGEKKEEEEKEDEEADEEERKEEGSPVQVVHESGECELGGLRQRSDECLQLVEETSRSLLMLRTDFAEVTGKDQRGLLKEKRIGRVKCKKLWSEVKGFSLPWQRR